MNFETCCSHGILFDIGFKEGTIHQKYEIRKAELGMKLNQKQIEESGIAGLKQYLVKCPLIDSDLPTNDKTASFDGSLTLYSKPGLAKKDMKGNIPIQIKSTTSNNVKKTKKISISTADLRNYYNQNGVIYFVIYVNPNEPSETHIFVKDLLRIDIKEIMEGKDHQKSIKVEVDDIDESVDDFRYVLETFLHNQDFQTKHSLEINPEDGDEKFIMRWVGEPANQTDFLERHSVPIYKQDGNMNIPVGRVRPENIRVITMSEETTVNIKTANSKTMQGKKQIFDKSIMKIRFGEWDENSIELNLEKGYIKFDTKLRGSIDNIIDILKLVEDLENGGSLFVDDIELLPNQNNSVIKTGVFDDENNLQEYFTDLKRLLLLNKVPLDFEFFSLSDSERTVLTQMVNRFLAPGEDSIDEYDFAGYRIYCLTLDKNVFNIFDDKVIDKVATFVDPGNDSEPIRVSIYTMLKADSIVRFPYINYKGIQKSIKMSELNNDRVKEGINLLAFQFIKAYDQKLNQDFLNIALDILNEIPIADDRNSVFAVMNKAQIFKRRKKVPIELISELLKISEDYKEDSLIQFGINILLDNNERANQIFGQLSEDEKENYLNMPISIFFNEEIDALPSRN